MIWVKMNFLMVLVLVLANEVEGLDRHFGESWDGSFFLDR